MGNNKALIVGASGFLASYLAEKLSALGYQLDGIDINIVPRRPALFGTIKTPDQIKTIENNYKVVFLLASFIPYGGMNTPHSRLVTDNIDLVSTICKHFSAARIVFTSSISVYGSNPELPLHENSAWYNPALYGLSKIAGESIVRNQNSWAIVRFSSLYGNGMNPTTFIPRAVQEAMQHKMITLWGDGSRLQDYFHVEDAAQICIAAAQWEGNGVLLGVNGQSHSNKEVAEMIVSILPEIQIKYINEDKSPSAQYDNTFTRNVLNWQPKQILSQELKNIIEHELKKI